MYRRRTAESQGAELTVAPRIQRDDDDGMQRSLREVQRSLTLSERTLLANTSVPAEVDAVSMKSNSKSTPRSRTVEPGARTVKELSVFGLLLGFQGRCRQLIGKAGDYLLKA